MAESKLQKIRVCFVAPKAYPIFNPDIHSVFGGAEVDLYLLATELAKDQQFNVKFVVGDYGQPNTEQREGVTLIKSVNPNKNMILQGVKVWRALRQADCDVYMHEACSLGTSMIAFFCKWYNRSFVYRTASSREADGSCFSGVSLRRFFVKWAFRRATVFIVQNEQDAVNAKKTINRTALVIRNACRIHSTENIKKSGVLWVGRSKHIKRPDLFIQLAKALPDIPFVMICQQTLGDSRYQELVETAGAVSNLEFIKRVPFQEIDRYFEKAMVSVNTSDSEGFPNTFIQSCKAGTAILSLNVNPDGFLNEHHCGFCAEGNWELFVERLKEWTQTDQAKESGLHGKEYIQSHHDITRIIKQYKELFVKSTDIQ